MMAVIISWFGMYENTEALRQEAVDPEGGWQWNRTLYMATGEQGIRYIGSVRDQARRYDCITCFPDDPLLERGGNLFFWLGSIQTRPVHNRNAIPAGGPNDLNAVEHALIRFLQPELNNMPREAPDDSLSVFSCFYGLETDENGDWVPVDPPAGFPILVAYDWYRGNQQVGDEDGWLTYCGSDQDDIGG